MSLFPVWTVRCDHPGCGARLSGADTAAKARDRARAAGWTARGRRVGDFCPAHKRKPGRPRLVTMITKPEGVS